MFLQCGKPANWTFESSPFIDAPTTMINIGITGDMTTSSVLDKEIELEQNKSKNFQDKENAEEVMEEKSLSSKSEKYPFDIKMSIKCICLFEF